MNLKTLVGSQFALFKNGILLTLIIVMAFCLIHWVWGLFLSIGYNPFSNQWANLIFKAIVLLVISYSIGIALETVFLKKIITGILSKLPLVGFLLDSFNHLERIKKDGLPEVTFELTPGSGVWLKGWVSKEWHDEKIGKVLCGVVLPMFVHPIGAYACIEKDKLIYTERQALQNIATCLSGGLIDKK
jgi:hypothetical protein